MINLLKNAIKFTRRGMVRIFASFDDVNDLLTVHIIDTGKGIKAEEI